MGVYEFDGGAVTPLPVGSGGTALGNANIVCPRGVWSAMAVRVTGHFTGTAPPASGDLVGGGFWHSGTGALGWAGVDFSSGSFDTGFVAQTQVSKYNLASNVGLNSQYTLNSLTNLGVITHFDSLQLQLTGTEPIASAGAPAVQAIGGLFFLSPYAAPVGPGQPPTNPTFPPEPPLNPPYYETEFYPNLPPRLVEHLKQSDGRTPGYRGHKVSCLIPKGSFYLTIPGNLALPITLPVMLVVDTEATAQWLKFDPGLYNQGGNPGQLEVRIYQGNPGTAPVGKWVASAGLLGNLRPVWVGQSTYSDLIPWGGLPMKFVVEISQISPIPDASSWDGVIMGLDNE